MLPVTSLTAGLTATAGGGNTSAAWGQALGLLGIGAAMVAMGEIMRTNRDLVEARAEVARLAVADERERFARDLHDLLGHSLSVIALKAQLAQKRLPDDPETAAADVADIETVTRDALREVRQTVSGYHRPALDAELEGARTALDAAGIDATIDRPQVALPADVEAVLAWTVREAATNASATAALATARSAWCRRSARRRSRSSTTATAVPGAGGRGTRAIGLRAPEGLACARSADAWRRARATTARASGCSRWSR